MRPRVVLASLLAGGARSRQRASGGVDATDGRGVRQHLRVPLLETSIDDVIPADLVKALEVDPRRIAAPPEYQTMECGGVVVWTGVRGWLARGHGDRTPARPRRP